MMFAKGEVYEENSIGPKIEPCGTHHIARDWYEKIRFQPSQIETDQSDMTKSRFHAV